MTCTIFFQNFFVFLKKNCIFGTKGIFIYKARIITKLNNKKDMPYKRKMSEETKKKIGDGNRGKKLSAETKRKISEAIKKLWAQAE